MIDHLFKFFAFVLLLPIMTLISCNQRISKNNSTRNLLYKTDFDTSKNNYGAHIEIRQILPNDQEMIPMSIDDRDIIGRSKYSRKDEISILHEYLRFQGDTTPSNKKYKFKGAHFMTNVTDVPGFTIQVEALYSFARMLTVGYPPIRPMLIRRDNGLEVNTDERSIQEVFEIYSRWLKDNNKNNFNHIDPPLLGTKYCWFGEDESMNLYWKKSI